MGRGFYLFASKRVNSEMSILATFVKRETFGAVYKCGCELLKVVPSNVAELKNSTPMIPTVIDIPLVTRFKSITLLYMLICLIVCIFAIMGRLRIFKDLNVLQLL